MKAIILAAGMGTRLGHYTTNLPKCMLPFKNRPLIEWQVQSLKNAGIDEIIIVTGYQSDHIKIPNAIYCHNPQFAETNMVHSLFCARKHLTDDVIVAYADIIYEPQIIEKLTKQPGDIIVTADQDYWDYWQARSDHPENDLESLIINQERIVDIGKPVHSRDEAMVRYVGLLRFSGKGIEALKQIYDDNAEKYQNHDEPWLRSKSFKKAYMTCMLQALINAGHQVTPLKINRGWMEFDTVEDYERACSWDQDGTLKRFIKLPSF